MHAETSRMDSPRSKAQGGAQHQGLHGTWKKGRRQRPTLQPTGKHFTVKVTPTKQAMTLEVMPTPSRVHLPPPSGLAAVLTSSHVPSFTFPNHTAQIRIPHRHTRSSEESEAVSLLGCGLRLTPRGQLEHSKVWSAWPIALGPAASSGLPLKILPLKSYGFAPSVPGAGIPMLTPLVRWELLCQGLTLPGWFGDTQEPTGRSWPRFTKLSD